MSLYDYTLRLALEFQALNPLGPFPKGQAPSSATPGMLGPIVDVVILIVVTLHAYTGSWGLAIILTAVLVKLLLLRLSVAQYTGMAWMQALAPMQKKLQEHYKGDKETANKKVMTLYKELKINPLSGCLPMLIQMPIFFAVFQALYRQDIFGNAKFFGIHLMYAALPGFAANRIQAYSHGAESVIDLNAPGVVSLMLGSNEVSIYLPALIIVAGYIGSSLFYQWKMKSIQKMMPKFNFGGEGGDPPKPPINTNFMMIIVVVFGMIIPAGAMLYFITQNVFMIVEYTVIMGAVIPKIRDSNLEEMYAKLIRPEQKTRTDGTGPDPVQSASSDGGGAKSGNGDKMKGESVAAEPARKPKRKRRRR